MLFLENAREDRGGSFAVVTSGFGECNFSCGGMLSPNCAMMRFEKVVFEFAGG